MKIGFSSLAAPAWDLAALIERAAEYGYDGIELRGLQGELHLPLVPALAGNPDGVRALCAEKKVGLICLGCSATLDSKKPAEVAANKAQIVEFIELAARLGCPFVRIFAGEVQRWDHHRRALGRIADALKSLVPIAARHGVTILVENGGDFAGSADLWFLVDAVSHPAVRCCWNQCNASAVRERPTISIPRLGRKIGITHVCDADFDDYGLLVEHKPLGEGSAEVLRQIELLKGLAYDGWLVFEWPRLWIETLAPAEIVLPAAAKFLRDAINAKPPVLSAYKGDKNAPRYPGRVNAAAAPAKAH